MVRSPTCAPPSSDTASTALPKAPAQSMASGTVDARHVARGPEQRRRVERPGTAADGPPQRVAEAVQRGFGACPCRARERHDGMSGTRHAGAEVAVAGLGVEVRQFGLAVNHDLCRRPGGSPQRRGSGVTTCIDLSTGWGVRRGQNGYAVHAALAGPGRRGRGGV